MNEMMSIERIMLDPSRIDRGNYTLTLAAEALRCGTCTDEQHMALQNDIFTCLAGQISRYTGGESTSVENRTAVKLMGSILYNTDLALLLMPMTRAVQRLFAGDFEALHAEGMQINRQYTLKAHARLREAKRGRIRTMCVYYNELLNKTLRQLIHSNDIRFDAKRNVTWVDYTMPTVNRKVCGIGGILHMLDELITENAFVNSFDPQELSDLQNRFVKELASPTGERINLGQLCFEQAILSMLAGREKPGILLNEDEVRTLTGLGLSGDECYYAAMQVVHRLGGRAPEKYLTRLLELSRASFAAVFSGGEAAIRRYAGII
ncbi:MAG: hypothetical protein IJ493_09425 [Clostridia bacterium]|nr:hypothetical protein [Clostridia bacterium]